MPPKRGASDAALSPRDVSDKKRFAAVAAEMATADLNINSFGLENGIALQAAAAAAQPSVAQTAIPFRWTQPAATPTGPGSPQPLTERLTEKLAPENLANLKANHDLFLNNLKDLTTLKDWWTKNREEWALRRKEVQIIQASIDNLLVQLGGEDNIYKSPHAAARQQYLMQKEVAQSRLEWFEGNEEQMDLVKESFKDIVTSTEETANKYRKSFILPKPEFPEGFDIMKKYDSSDLDENPSWWNEGVGFPALLAALRKYVRETMEDDRLKREFASESLTIVEQARGDTMYRQSPNIQSPKQIRGALKTARDDLASAAEQNKDDPKSPRVQNLKNMIAELERDLEEAERIEETNKDYLSNLDSRSTRLETEIRLLDREGAINSGIGLLLRKMADDMQANDAQGPWFMGRHPYILIVLRICRIYHLQRTQVHSLLTTLSDEALEQPDIAFICKKFVTHDVSRVKFQASLLEEFRPDKVAAKIWEDNGLKAAEERFEYEYEVMVPIVFQASSILKNRKDDLAKGVSAEEKLRDVALGGVDYLRPKEATKRPNSGDIKNLEDAKNKVYDANSEVEVVGNYRQPAEQAIRNLFVSPDVAEYFRFTYKMPRRTFIDLANSFLKEPLDDVMFDAFLVICHDANDLFTINWGGSISYCEKGWERVPEMRIGGPVRSVRHVKPIGQDDLEQWMLKNVAFLIRADRDVLMDQLYDTVKAAFNKMTRDTFDERMLYFSRVGRMYTIPIDLPSSSPKVYRRLDNGWNIDPKSLYEPITEQWYFSNLRKSFTTPEVRTTILNYTFPNGINEIDLYNAVEQFLEVPGYFLSFGKVKINRHRFHLFLRWLTWKEPASLILRRDGSVTGTMVQ